jgi:hypothetical protein
MLDTVIQHSTYGAWEVGLETYQSYVRDEKYCYGCWSK